MVQQEEVPGSLAEELVTVVVPARNEELFIGACLDSVLAQDHRQLQVIVVDGASSDRTAEIVKGFAERDGRVELLINPEQIIPVSLNLALGAARGRWLVRVDAHATIPSHYVSTAVAHLTSGRWAAVGGRKDGIGVTPAGRAIAAVMASPFGVGNSTYHYGTRPQTVEHVPFGAYSVEVARRLGGWNPNLRVNQDFEFDYRLRLAGHEILFDPRLTIEWRCRQNVPDLYRQYHRYGRGKVRVARLHPQSMRMRHLAAPGLVALLAAAAGTAPRRPGVAAVLVSPYALLLAVATARVRQDLDDDARRWVAPAFMAMHVGWGVGFWQALGGVLGEYVRTDEEGLHPGSVRRS
jgi:succinoglycan biosynthesis protein ExoA